MTRSTLGRSPDCAYISDFGDCGRLRATRLLKLYSKIGVPRAHEAANRSRSLEKYVMNAPLGKAFAHFT
ncbi:hypothetical protein HDU79_002370, partial [Rhizoclosmatium sp. JEL0117]